MHSPMPPRKTYLTPEEYLAIDHASEHRFEFYDGQMFRRGDPPRAIDGASLNRNRIAGNLFAAIRGQLQDGPFETFVSDIRLPLAGREFAYPDLVVVAGKPELAPDRLDTLINPRVIIEVLPNFAVDWDWGHRFHSYRQLPALHQFILIGRDAPEIASFDRQPDDTWLRTDIAWPDGILTFNSIGVAVPIRDIYARVFPHDDSAGTTGKKTIVFHTGIHASIEKIKIELPRRD